MEARGELQHAVAVLAAEVWALVKFAPIMFFLFEGLLFSTATLSFPSRIPLCKEFSSIFSTTDVHRLLHNLITRSWKQPRRRWLPRRKKNGRSATIATAADSVTPSTFSNLTSDGCEVFAPPELWLKAPR